MMTPHFLHSIIRPIPLQQFDFHLNRTGNPIVGAIFGVVLVDFSGPPPHSSKSGHCVFGIFPFIQAWIVFHRHAVMVHSDPEDLSHAEPPSSKPQTSVSPKVHTSPARR